MQLVTKVDTCVSLHPLILQPIGLLMSCLHVKLGRLVFLLYIKIQFVKIAEMCLIREKFEPLRNVIFLAILFNSTVIEIYGDKIQVSHSFYGCQPLT